MDKKRTLDDYKTAGAWMRICKHVLAKTNNACWSVLAASDRRIFTNAERKISALGSRAEDNMFVDFPELNSDAFDIFYGALDIEPRTDTDREQQYIMQELVIKLFGENWENSQGQGVDADSNGGKR